MKEDILSLLSVHDGWCICFLIYNLISTSSFNYLQLWVFIEVGHKQHLDLFSTKDYQMKFSLQQKHFANVS